MKVSLNIVKSLVSIDLPPVDQLVQRINERLGGVEDIIELGPKYKDAKIVKVIECDKHPNADKLSLCKIDTGAGDLVQVVCGANNVRSGMWAVWLPPHSVVPSTYDDVEPFVLSARELRGEMSNGMLASARELAIGDDHKGIVDITEQDVPEGVVLQPGVNFAQVFGLDDTIIDIENKMFTHRPDLFGQLGVAREIAGIFGNQFASPSWYREEQQFNSLESDTLQLDVTNEASDKVPRFMAVALKDVGVNPSPLWLQIEIVRMGGKPINSIVDATNYIMLMTAQPVHAYDYDKLRGQKIGVRMARAGETIKLINGKTYELTGEDIVIVDGEGVIGLGGVMGGLDSEVTAETKNIVLEVATFDMYSIRKTSMRHGLFTDAVTRFNKGQSSRQNAAVLAQLMTMVGGQQASHVYDIAAPRHGTMNDTPSFIGIDFINERLGLELTESEIVKILHCVEFGFCSSCGEDDPSLLHLQQIPFWRMDIENPEDVVEEIGRLYGFDLLPRALPLSPMKPTPKNVVRQAKQAIRQSLVGAGANEVLTYSFVHENILTRAEQDATQAFRLSNALSPDLQYYRLSVLPSLLDKVHPNIKSGHDEFALFEIGKGHNKKYHGDDDEGLPSEMNFVDLVYASKKPQAGAAFYHVRRLLDALAKDMRCQFVYKPVTESLDYPVTAPFDLERSALIETADGVFIGMVGELKQSVVRGFKLPEYTAAATLDLEGLVRSVSEASQNYRPLSRYPSVSQDVSIKVGNDQAYEVVRERVASVIATSALDVEIAPVSIYQAEVSPEIKTVTLRLTFTSHEKTLSDKDIAPYVKEIEKLGL